MRKTLDLRLARMLNAWRRSEASSTSVSCLSITKRKTDPTPTTRQTRRTGRAHRRHRVRLRCVKRRVSYPFGGCERRCWQARTPEDQVPCWRGGYTGHGGPVRGPGRTLIGPTAIVVSGDELRDVRPVRWEQARWAPSGWSGFGGQARGGRFDMRPAGLLAGTWRCGSERAIDSISSWSADLKTDLNPVRIDPYGG